MLGDPDDDYPDIPFETPLTADEAARVLGFRGADDEYTAWRRAVDDPKRRGPPPQPPSWRTRIPGWDITKPDGGIRLTADGQGWYGDSRKEGSDDAGSPATGRYPRLRGG